MRIVHESVNKVSFIAFNDSDYKINTAIYCMASPNTTFKAKPSSFPSVVIVTTWEGRAIVDSVGVEGSVEDKIRTVSALFRKLQKIEERGGEKERELIAPLIKKEIEERCGKDWVLIYNSWANVK